MAERLMGIETEYAISGQNWSGGGVDQSVLVDMLLRVARRRLIHLPDLLSGLYLANGSRFYVDYGNHPELGTPECGNPWDVVRYILAGERLLADLVQKVNLDLPNAQAMLFKSNVDYSGTWVTWGCHESYMHRMTPHLLSDQVVPHLVTRIIYTGAGGFNAMSGGIDFTLSPRVPYLFNVRSNNSTSDRGIFHTKDESLSRPGLHRLHVICGESLCSETAMWLKVATTALVVAMAEAGLRPGAQVQLRWPLQAMQSIASDQTCMANVEMFDSRWSSAIEIQYHYLTLAEKHLDHPCMPAWAEAACREWRKILNRLLDGPDAVATSLDWAIKRAVYASHAHHKGVSWRKLGHWAPILCDLRRALDSSGQGYALCAKTVLGKRSPVHETVERLTPSLHEKGLRWDGLEPVLELRKELFEIDTRFGQVGGGIFASLERSGALTHHVPGVDAVREAMNDPPELGRARVRGAVIKRLAGLGRYRCDWQGVVDIDNKRVLDLSEPLETEERWIDFADVNAIAPPILADSLLRLTAADAGIEVWP